MPATCHSFKSRYSFIASAARNDRLRPVLLASFSSRVLLAGSMRTLTVVEDMFHTLFVLDCVHISTDGSVPQHEGSAYWSSRHKYWLRFVKSRLAPLRLLP